MGDIDVDGNVIFKIDVKEVVCEDVDYGSGGIF
jgi:hypothetical protein